MALEIIDEKIVGAIDNLQEKLKGKIPVDILELLVLVNSWGRSETFITYNNDMEINIEIEKCRAKDCYDLSILDTSQIKNMNDVFMYSLFDGDISQWNTSNVTSMVSMFNGTTKFNGDISDWDISNVTSMNRMFYGVDKFNGDISQWDVSKVTNMSYMFSFSEKFNQDIGKWNVSA